jgi:hypothetical protein
VVVAVVVVAAAAMMVRGNAGRVSGLFSDFSDVINTMFRTVRSGQPTS